MIRSLQPGALINDRTGKVARGLAPLANFCNRAMRN